MTELEKEVLELINLTMDNIYTGRLVVIEDEDSYTLELYLNREISPMVLYYQGSKDGFLRFVEKEIRFKRLDEILYSSLIKTGEGKTEIITIN